MKKLTILLCVSVLSVISFGQSLTPDVIATSGDYFVNENASLSWTLGEAVIETFSNESLMLTQGFQQSYYQIVSVNDPENLNFHVKVFPNPAKDFVNIEITSEEKSTLLKLEIFDFLGNCLLERDIMNETFKERVDLSSYATNMFLLKVTNIHSSRTHSFKILKVKF